MTIVIVVIVYSIRNNSNSYTYSNFIIRKITIEIPIFFWWKITPLPLHTLERQYSGAHLNFSISVFIWLHLHLARWAVKYFCLLHNPPTLSLAHHRANSVRDTQAMWAHEARILAWICLIYSDGVKTPTCKGSKNIKCWIVLNLTCGPMVSRRERKKMLWKCHRNFLWRNAAMLEVR